MIFVVRSGRCSVAAFCAITEKRNGVLETELGPCVNRQVPELVFCVSRGCLTC